jgi:branched-chain amino acid transport system substrate-binding protein
MKKGMVLFSAVCLMLSFCVSNAMAANPKEYKLAVLLPLTGVFAGVAETQKDGILLAVDEINSQGGLSMPWGKVKVKAMVADEEAKIDVALRRFRYMVDEGANAVTGQSFSPIASAINAAVKKNPMPYVPCCMMGIDQYKKNNLAVAAFGGGFSSWTVGFMDGAAAINTLNKKRIYFLARSDSWGYGIRDGVYAAAKMYGGQIVGYDEVAQGTSDFTTILEKVKNAHPDVFISAQFAADAVALLKQCYQMGLNQKMTIFNAWMTNVVAQGIPPEALEGVYSMHFFYWNMKGWPEPDVVKAAEAYTDLYQKKYGMPPDSYATIAYIGVKELFRLVQKAGSFNADAVASALAQNRNFTSVKGPGLWRKDHEPIYKNAGYLVRGKAPKKRTSKWDLFDVVGSQGGEEVFPSLQSLGY